ncbi:MAG: 50S ribosomal protein L21 [Patescibacteria group bacterium]
MHSYAVIVTGGKQYIAEVGKDLTVDYIAGELKQKVSFDHVLLHVQDDDKLTIGMPHVPKAVVEAEIIEQGRGEKIRVARFKAKSRYRKITGFKPFLTKVHVTAITI